VEVPINCGIRIRKKVGKLTWVMDYWLGLLTVTWGLCTHWEGGPFNVAKGQPGLIKRQGVINPWL